ncbi:MAG TPA: phospho-sugar mutase [Smithellaceae bacterium]|jgi:phosphoglucomutase|nr:phospho-sugar mutase [Syntrophaceae bacterium]HNV57042.1 phospho-sugar mutase [Smithellaceae bacterium]HNY96602.1 phospho-sugar mutase [Smithellaceae bacterium]HOH57538.1 phospho-sugar mutase [Smithellaceae bacterium]HPV72203.1 phospho-sugar mutase [Smithellaceae bacterium]
MTYQETYLRWRACVTEPDLLAELESIRDDDAQIQDRFLRDLPFGTAGLRGVIGAGIARMNRYVVGRATQGLADYLTGVAGAGASAVIAYDSRRFSFEFARETACVLAANGIRVYLFKQLTSVPELSFAVRHLKASGGVVITASHNPGQYNGYKVYAAYGGQLGPQESLAVMARIQKLDPFLDVKRIGYEEGTAKGQILEIGEEIDRMYYDRMIRLCGAESAGDLKVVYTPLHGSGLRTVENVFPLAGIRNWYVVPEQRMPDGSFPTVASPNPEDPKAMEMAIALAGKMEADLAIGTDPDADRMGAAVRRPDGTYTMLTGNQIGCLLIHYLLEKRRQSGELRASDYIVKSFVSTRMADAIAAHYGIHCHTVLTGFRFISELIVQKEPTGAEFIFGFEESFGFLAGTFALDKDGALAALLLCKAAQFFRASGQSLTDALEALYREHGYYLESVKNIAFEGLDGMEKMKGIMERLRARPIDAIGGLPVRFTEDYRSRTRTGQDGIVSALELPSTDALRLLLDSGAWLCIRPSGTEPKIKIYYAVSASSREAAEGLLKRISTGFEQMI